MFSIARFLDHVKAAANIESDYRLAKVIGKNHSVITNYRSGKSLPNESMIEQLCALSGDDPDLIAAQVQAARVKDAPARAMWERIAARLQGGASTAFLSVLISLGLIAGTAQEARASAAPPSQMSFMTIIYIVSISVFVSARRALVRLRRIKLFGVLI